MRRIKPKNVVFAVIWLVAFVGAATYVASGGLADYTSRRGRALAELIEGVRESIGSVPVFLIISAIGVAIAAWVVLSKDDGDDERAERTTV